MLPEKSAGTPSFIHGEQSDGSLTGWGGCSLYPAVRFT